MQCLVTYKGHLGVYTYRYPTLVVIPYTLDARRYCMGMGHVASHVTLDASQWPKRWVVESEMACPPPSSPHKKF